MGGTIMASAEGRVHLVGSLGLPDAETAFRMVGERIGARATRYPDGEPGDRGYWIRWQNAVFANHPDLELIEARKIEGYQDTKMRPLYRLRDGVDPKALVIKKLGYADAALASWEVFKRLRDEGVVPAGTRFLVCLPSCAALLTSFFPGDQARLVEPALEDAMRREVETMAAAIPAADLAIQWDVAYEIVAHDGAQPPLHYDDALAGSVERIARQVDWVPAGVEAGVHLCYGDPGHKHIVEPKDFGTCVAFANGIADKVTRNLDWMHMPVPRDRSDDAYFAPLDDLKLRPETELYLGLVHYTDGVEGTRKRLAAAHKHAHDFGIATECGFGRRDPDTVPELLGIHAELAGA
jgi:hypothetical protein